MSLAMRAAPELLGASDSVLGALRYDFDVWGMPHQFIPPGSHNIVIWFGGRGAAKTRACSEAIRRDVERGVKRLALIGSTIDNVRVMIEGPAGLQDVFPPHQRPRYLVAKKKVVFHDGAEAYCLSVEAGADAWRGKGYEVAWLDDLSTYGDALEAVWTQSILSARIGSPRIYAATNPSPPLPFLKTLIREADDRGITVIPCSSFDNFNNLPPETQKQIRALAKTKLGRSEVFPEFFEVEGALWQESWIKIQPAPPKGLTVVAVDPAGTGKPNSDEHGIVCVRRSVSPTTGKPVAHVLRDASFRGPVTAWPKVAVELAKKFGATVMVIERNRGLDYLREAVRPLSAIRIEEVYSTRSKGDRAIPVAQLYELGQVFHDHEMPELQNQMTTWVPWSPEELKIKKRATSPDRLDALVHAIRFLKLDVAVSPQTTGPTGPIIPSSW